MGRIEFEEDSLYYIVTPLFLQNAATAKLHPEPQGKSKKRYLKANMILYVDPASKKDMTERINAEIRATLG